MNEINTGSDVIKRALSLMGYWDMTSEVDDLFLAQGQAALFQIFDEIALQVGCNERYFNCDENLPLDDDIVSRVLPYGVAMLIAAASGDSITADGFCRFYEKARKTIRKRPKKRINRLFHGDVR